MVASCYTSILSIHIKNRELCKTSQFLVRLKTIYLSYLAGVSVDKAVDAGVPVTLPAPVVDEYYR